MVNIKKMRPLRAEKPVSDAGALPDLTAEPPQTPPETAVLAPKDGKDGERDGTLDDPTRYGDWQVKGRCIDF